MSEVIYWMFVAFVFFLGLLLGVLGTIMWIFRSMTRVQNAAREEQLRRLLREMEKEEKEE